MRWLVLLAFVVVFAEASGKMGIATFHRKGYSEQSSSDDEEDRCAAIRLRILTQDQKIPLEVCEEDFSPYGIFITYCAQVLSNEEVFTTYFPDGHALEGLECNGKTILEYKKRIRLRVGQKEYSLGDKDELPVPPKADWPVDVEMVAIVVGGIQRGSEVENFQYPWIVAIHKHPKPSGIAEPFCTGSLVSPSWVITAAHCFQNDDKQVKWEGQKVSQFNNFKESYINTFFVSSGRSDLARSVDDDKKLRTHSDARADDLILTDYAQVQEVIIHPEYYPYGDHDLALVKLARPLINRIASYHVGDNKERFAYVFPKIASFDDIAEILKNKLPQGPRLTVAGYGLNEARYKKGWFDTTDYTVSEETPKFGTELSVETTKLWKAKTRVTPCELKRRRFEFNICAKDLDGLAAIAAGDSGGPLFFWINRQAYLVGVAESAPLMQFPGFVQGQLTDPTKAQVWTNLKDHIDFIREHRVEFYEMQLTKSDVYYPDFSLAENEEMQVDGAVVVHYQSTKRYEYSSKLLEATFKSLCNWDKIASMNWQTLAG